jgi:putative hydrolase of the HAD superfamily
VTRIAGVLFDIGGVVTGSPLHAIARYERDHGLPAKAISRAIMAAGEAGAWSRLERGELALADFGAPFETECRAHGVELSAPGLMEYLAAAGGPRPVMLTAIARLRAQGLRVGALTNNWRTAITAPGGAAAGEVPDTEHPLASHFDVVVESRLVGLRKPDPRIYELACGLLGVPPAGTAFLDDIGANLKTARALGMATIKVDEPEPALEELSRLLGVSLM